MARPLETTVNPRRRRLLRMASAAAGSLLAPLRAQAASSLSLQPAALEVTSSSALIWISGHANAALAVDVAREESMREARRVPAVTLTPERDFTGAVAIDGLTADATWFYRVVDTRSGMPVSRTGRFHTAPAKPQAFTFAWSGDMQEQFQPFRLFNAIGDRKPDFFLLVGDTIYADSPRAQFYPSLRHYRSKHYANRRDPYLQEFLLRHPAYAIWDDHETENDAHAGHPHMALARQVFREYWPCRCVTGDGLYRRFTWAGVDFFILDTRSYRSAQSAEGGPGKTMLGPAQKAWFLDAISSSVAPFKFVVTPTPFQGGGQDTWGGYRAERDEIVSHIRSRKIGGLVFLTTDYHLAREWANPRMPFRDFMAGPIATRGHYWSFPSARERHEKAGIFHYDGYNFGLVKVDPTAGTGEVSFVDQSGKTLHAVAITA